jgi:hypothetical protein
LACGILPIRWLTIQIECKDCSLTQFWCDNLGSSTVCRSRRTTERQVASPIGGAHHKTGSCWRRRRRAIKSRCANRRACAESTMGRPFRAGFAQLALNAVTEGAGLIAKSKALPSRAKSQSIVYVIAADVCWPGHPIAIATRTY